MRIRRIIVISLLLLAAVAVFAADPPKDRSVIVKETQVRDKQSYAGKILGKLVYTDRVQVIDLPAGSSWAKVRFAAKKLEGWVHLSTLSKEPRLVIKEGDKDVKTPPEGYEVALAGKGFNEEVEAETRKDQTLEYDAVDDMEGYSSDDPVRGSRCFHHAGRADRGRGCAMKTLARCLLGLSVIVLTTCGSFGISLDRGQIVSNLWTNRDQLGKKTEEGFSPEQEYYIGRAVAAQILGDKRYQPSTEEKSRRYLNLLGLSLAYSSTMPETYNGWHFLVLDSSEINAFGAPSGFVLVSRELLRCAKSEDEVAAILAHEIAHVTLGHGIGAISAAHKNAAYKENAKAIFAGAVEVDIPFGFLLGEKQLGDMFVSVFADIGETLVNKGYSREQEYQADATAVSILQAAGYDPRALVRMLEVMQTKWKTNGLGIHEDPPVARRSYQGAREGCCRGAHADSRPRRSGRGQEGAVPGSAGNDLAMPDANGGNADRSRRLRRVLLGCLVGVGAAAVVLALWLPGVLENIEYRTWDWRVRLFARPGPATDDIALIFLDQQSLDWGKKENGLSWPWPREMYAIVSEFCRRAGATALAFDVLYTEPSFYGVEDDALFGDVMKDYGRVAGGRVPHGRGRPGVRVAAERSPIPADHLRTRPLDRRKASGRNRARVGRFPHRRGRQRRERARQQHLHPGPRWHLPPGHPVLRVRRQRRAFPGSRRLAGGESGVPRALDRARDAARGRVRRADRPRRRCGPPLPGPERRVSVVQRRGDHPERAADPRGRTAVRRPVAAEGEVRAVRLPRPGTPRSAAFPRRQAPSGARHTRHDARQPPVRRLHADRAPLGRHRAARAPVRRRRHRGFQRRDRRAQRDLVRAPAAARSGARRSAPTSSAGGCTSCRSSSAWCSRSSARASSATPPREGSGGSSRGRSASTSARR